MAAPTKQEQQPASDAISEVAPGVLRLQLPIQLPGLGHVNCYALEDGHGFALVDPGLPGPTAWHDLLGRLDLAGVPLRRVHTVVVTHSHPDHFGGAARLRAETGADIVTHRSFRLWFDPEASEEDPEAANADRGDDLDSPTPVAIRPPWERPTPWGTQYEPTTEGRPMDEVREGLIASGIPRPTRRLEDADEIVLARRPWVAVHTPGHTPDHLCLYDPVGGVLLSGDHVLPTITPHISGLGQAPDPLDEFFTSLERMRTLEGVAVVLPAHGHPFTDLAGRIDAIERHHQERLERLQEASIELGRAATVRELMERLFSPRAWGSMAESETYAHLEHLRLSGEARSEWRDGTLLFEVGV